MTKRIPIAAAAAALFLAAGAANAQQLQPPRTSPLYGELGYTWLDARDDLGFHAHPQALRGIIGYDFHPNFAVEGMAAFGTTSSGDQGVDIKLSNAYGVFLKPKYDINNFEVFGRLGWVHSRLRASGFGVSATDSNSDFAWGVGANYNFSPRTYASLDYTRYYDKGSSRVDGVTLGIGWRF